MNFAIEIDPLAGVFGFLDSALPERLRKAAEETDLGTGRLAEISGELWAAMFCNRNHPLGLCASGDERRAIAKILNLSFRLQFKECPLRQFLAKYRLYYHEDMADALAAAYGLSKRGGDPETALNADYSVDARGLLYHEDLNKYRDSTKDGRFDYYWRQLRPFYEEGDQIVKNCSGGYDYVLLVRGDRLVWSVEGNRYLLVGISLKRKAEWDHFKALGGCKAFLNGEFTWPPDGWMNPVSDEAEAESLAARPPFKKPDSDPNPIPPPQGG